MNTDDAAFTVHHSDALETLRRMARSEPIRADRLRLETDSGVVVIDADGDTVEVRSEP